MKALSLGSLARRDFRRAVGGGGAGGKGQQRVRRRGVAVDGDRVERILDAALEQRLQHGRRQRRVGEHERQHGGHVGHDHAGALGHAVDGDLGLAELDGRGRDLREGVGGHDRFGGAHPVAGGGAFGERASTPSNLVASSGSPITPVEARYTSLALQPTALAASRRRQRRGLPSGLAGERIGVAGIHHQRAGASLSAACSLARHHSTGADGHFDLVKTPATVVPLSITASSTSVRPL